MKSETLKKLRTAFITGFLVLVPVLATIDIFLWLVMAIDRNARKYTTDLFGLHSDFIGLGLVVAIAVILVVGVLTQNIFGKWVVAQFDALLRHFPFVGGIYGIIKQFLETVFSPSNNKFNEAVLIEFPQKGVYSIGFRTGTPDANLLKGIEEPMANIFVPLVPNPTAGFYLLVPESSIRRLDMSVQEAFKVAISMGVVTSEDHTKEAREVHQHERR